jgi:hypothetical protein
MPTALRESTIAFPTGSTACLYTDGVVEARANGSLLGRQRLVELVRECGSRATAAEILDRVTIEARAIPDDMAACVMHPLQGAPPPTLRTEELAVGAQAVALAEPFLLACGVGAGEARLIARSAQQATRRAGAVVLRVSWTSFSVDTEILPTSVEAFTS